MRIGLRIRLRCFIEKNGNLKQIFILVINDLFDMYSELPFFLNEAT